MLTALDFQALQTLLSLQLAPRSQGGGGGRRHGWGPAGVLARGAAGVAARAPGSHVDGANGVLPRESQVVRRGGGSHSCTSQLNVSTFWLNPCVSLGLSCGRIDYKGEQWRSVSPCGAAQLAEALETCGISDEDVEKHRERFPNGTREFMMGWVPSFKVGRRMLKVSKPMLKAPMVSAYETIM